MLRPEPFAQEVNRLFNSLLEPANEQTQRWMPAMDLVEAEDHFVLNADLPGLGEDDVSIEIRDGTLTVSGERKHEHEQKERGYYRVERTFGRFSRSLQLPEGIDPDSVSAEFDKGVLSIRIPKPEERKPRRVQIKAGDNGSPKTVEGTATDK
jgi:HSP20 family protein